MVLAALRSPGDYRSSGGLVPHIRDMPDKDTTQLIQEALDRAMAEYQALDKECQALAAQIDQVQAHLNQKAQARLVAMGKVEALAQLVRPTDT